MPSEERALGTKRRTGHIHFTRVVCALSAVVFMWCLNGRDNFIVKFRIEKLFVSMYHLLERFRIAVSPARVG